MNEQLQKALVELIGKASNGIDASVSFLSEEIPDVIHQLLVWYAIESAIHTVIGVAIVAMWIACERLALKKISDWKWEVEDVFMNYLLIGMFPRIAAFVTACIMVNIDWLKIWIAPKIWLIEYASQLSK